MIRYSFILGFLLVTVGCGGSDSGSNNPPPNKPTPDPISSQFCSGIVSFQDYLLSVSEYDTDNSGCLEDSELQAAIAQKQAEQQAAQQQREEELAAIARRTVTVDGVVGDRLEVNFDEGSIIGNADVIDGKAQIHSNMLEGKFQVVFSLFPSLSESEYVLIGFSNGTAAQVLGDIDGIEVSDLIVARDISIFDTGFECTYQAGLQFDCESGGIAIDTIDTTGVFDSAPTNGYLVLLVCDDDEGCYPNHVSIPFTLN